MANTRFTLTPLDAEYPSANFPQFLTIHSTERRHVLAFDASTSESCMWTKVIPQGWTGTVSGTISYCMASATSGSLSLSLTIEAVTSGDALDLDAATSYDSVNTGTDAAVPGTAGYMEQISFTLTNLDSSAAGDLVRIKLSRDISDTAAGDAYVFAVEIRDAV